MTTTNALGHVRESLLQSVARFNTIGTNPNKRATIIGANHGQLPRSSRAVAYRYRQIDWLLANGYLYNINTSNYNSYALILSEKGGEYVRG